MAVLSGFRTNSHYFYECNVLHASGGGKYTTGMLEYLLNAVDGILDDAPIYEQELRDAEDAELESDDD